MEHRKRKTENQRDYGSLRPLLSALCFLPPAFSLLPSAVCFLLSAFCLLETQTVAPAEADCPGILARQEVEGTDGALVELARILEVPAVRTATTRTGSEDAHQVSFWDLGPSKTELNNWHNAECDTCAPPAGFDEVDGSIDRLEEFVDMSKSLKAQPIDDLLASWQSWLAVLVDDDSADDFDDTFKAMAQGAATEEPPVAGLPGWRDDLVEIRDTQLPPCAITSSAGAEVTIDNSPCAINQARKDEFNRELANIRDFLGQLTEPHSKFYHDLIIDRILLPELPRRLSVYLVGADKIRNLEATIDTIDMVDGVLTYTFTSTFDYFDDYAADDWLSGQNHGQGTVAVTSLELGGSPATNGLITYTFAWAFISYDVPKPVPTIVPGPVIVSKKITSWTSVAWTWIMEPADFPTTFPAVPMEQTGTFHHHLEMPKPYACSYRLEDRCSLDACEGREAVCIGLGNCSAVKDLLTPPGVVNPPGLSDSIPTTILDEAIVDVSCDAPPTIPPDEWGCPDPGAPYLANFSVGCALVNPHPNDIDQTVGCCGGGSGTRDVDDDHPAGTGLTISPPRTVDAPRTVAAFAEGVDAFDAFVNGVRIPFGTSDADTEDEFWPQVDTESGALALLAHDIETFRAGSRAFSEQMWTMFGEVGGVNPVTYRWKDSAGNHRVEVEASKFALARIKKKKKGNFLVGKICQALDRYSDNGAKTWVKVTQQDPNTDLGFWSWNPFSQNTVTKKACASYSFNRVGLVRCP